MILDNASVMLENVEAYGGVHQGADLVADRTPSFTGHMQAKKMVHDGRHIQLQGPTYWKWKKPSYPQSSIFKNYECRFLKFEFFSRD